MITLNSESKTDMKKYFLIALVALSFASCEEELSVNTPAFEATKGYSFWRATKMQAFVKDGDLVIVGATNDENVTLYIDNYEMGGEYILGKTNFNVATYSKVVDDIKYNYSTSSTTGSGYVRIDPVEKQVPGTISGVFMTEMVPTGTPLENTPSVNFNKGVFFQIPLSEAPAPEPVPEPDPAPAP